MKRYIFLVLTLIMSWNVLFASVKIGNLYYNLNSRTKTASVINIAGGLAWVDRSSSSIYEGDIVIPSSVLYDGVTYTVTSIGEAAFYNGYSITSITIPNSVTSIWGWAFYHCSSLTSITIPNGVTSIGSEAFYHCSRLTSITIPDGVTSIGRSTFQGCSKLTSITIPDGVKWIGDSAFNRCYKLTSITIPNSVTSIGSGAFYGCTGLTSISIPDSVTSIGSEAFYDCYAPTSITIPNGVTYIGEYTFCGFKGLTSITIPNSVTSIGRGAFYGCTGLTSITIPNRVTSIGATAFYGCTGLTSISIPDSVTSIGSKAFYNCSGLTSMSVQSTTPPYLTDTCGIGSIPIKIPCGTKTIYKNKAQWEYLEDNFIEDPFYNYTFYTNDSTMGTILLQQPAQCDDNTAIIVAKANKGYYFVRWSDGNTDNPRTVVVNGDTAFTAEFSPYYKVITKCDAECGVVTGDGTYKYGEQVTLTAIPNSGYEFKSWSNGLTYNPYRITVTKDITLEAEFIPATAIDNISASDDNQPQKVLYQGQLLILSGGSIYTTTGAKVNLDPQVISSGAAQP